MTRREFLQRSAVLSMGLGLALWGVPARAGAGAGTRAGRVRVALYAGPGTWLEGREAIHNFLRFLGWEGQEVSPSEVVRWDADPEGVGYSAIWVPGGWAYDYRRALGEAGQRRLRAFIASGGLYIGSCAGAYFASDFILWEGRRYEYDLDLFAGSSQGPIPSIAPWPRWALTPVWGEGNSFPLSMIYYGGQVFRPILPSPQEVRVVARWGEEAGPQAGKPAGIVIRYGRGYVLLLGPHPEIGYDFARQRWDREGGHGAQWAWLQAQLEALPVRRIRR